MRRSTIGLAFAAAVLLASPAPAAEIKIGFIGVFTGPDSSTGLEIERGADLYVKTHKVPGGHTLTLLKRDTAGPAPDRAKRLAEELVVRDKVVLITGASSGIGRVTARTLALQGWHVFMANRDEGKTRPVLDEIAAASGGTARAEFLPLELGDLASVRAAAKDLAARPEPIHVLINNAGVSVFGEVLDYDWAAWQDVIDTDLLGVVHGVAACYPLMVKQQSGHIINTGSLASLVPTPWVTSYSAAKCGVWGLSMALRTEAAAYGVRVSCVCPAAVETPMADRARYLNVDKTEAMKVVPGSRISPEVCASAILTGIERNDALITPSAAKWMSLAYRVTPDGAEKMMQGIAKKLSAIRAEFLKKRGSAA